MRHARSRRARWLTALIALCAIHVVVRGQALPDEPPATDDSQHEGDDLIEQQTRLQLALDELHARHQSIETERELIDQRQEALRAQLSQHLRWLYRLQRSGLLPMAAGVEAAFAHVARIDRLTRRVQQDAASLDALTAQERQLEGRQRKLHEALGATQEKLKHVEDAKQALAKVAARIDHTLQAPKPSDHVRRGTVEGIGSGEGIARRRGQLSLPITREFRVREARRRESEGPGLEFLCAAGTAVKAVASGRVAFTDRYGTYGRLIILDHDDGYYTVYAGLGRVDVRVGAEVREGATLGAVGPDPAPSALFFEIRHGTRTLEPGPWLGL